MTFTMADHSHWNRHHAPSLVKGSIMSRSFAAVAVLGVAVLAGCGGGPAPTPDQPRPAPPTAERKEAEAPEGTPDQRAALRAARSYLDTGGFSRRELKSQLTSEYEQHDPAAVEWALSHAGADWVAEAEEDAASYREMGMAWPAIEDQLTSRDGDGYERAEAVEGVKRARANEQ